MTDTNRGNSTYPDVEDVNRDNTMNTINAYFKFEVNIERYGDNDTDIPVGTNYIADFRRVDNFTLPNGETGKARWLLYKIPINEFTDANKVVPNFRFSLYPIYAYVYGRI